jgi:4-alpha-glucanotransferase
MNTNGFKQRGSGVLMHISSLPGPYGIGTLGKNAYQFIDFLREAGQSYWQILPVCPTSYGDSPYQSFSTFAGNPYFIDFELLEKDGLISKSDYEGIDWGSNKSYVDYGLLYVKRHELFAKIQEYFEKNTPADYKAFCKKNAWWLNDFALFMAVKDAHNGIAFLEWEDDIRMREEKAVKEWTKKCARRIEYYKMLQYLFFKQWNDLRAYAAKNDIKIIGDIPIYVAADSADVWTHPENFKLNKKRVPVEVAGCPPDAFTELGQLWGNPVYNWKQHKADGYGWWKQRLKASLEIYDILRIDHFRGFESFYTIKYGMPDAKLGVWRKGPGANLFKEVKNEFGDVPIIAEDLGFMTDEVRAMLKKCAFPGMKVVQFGFDGTADNAYLPDNYPENSIVYTGTHDNDTILGWTETGSPNEVENAMKYLKVEEKADVREAMMKAALNSKSFVCVLTMQDLIGLGHEARMNTPSTVGDNWKWRATEKQITKKIAAWLKKATEEAGR